MCAHRASAVVIAAGIVAFVLYTGDPPTPEDRTTETRSSHSQALSRDVGHDVVTYSVGDDVYSVSLLGDTHQR